ncbi:PaaI family thioesterase [Celeribacter halophilus]|uniref:PaaI family thioesterase n=1 Tax=Celeribacter halophilus TaxID=576117 RepID=UPI003A8E5E38
MQADRTKIARQFIEGLPHCNALGMSLSSIGEGEAEILMPYAEKLIGDPETGVIHGGAVSALMDTCAGAAVMSHPEAGLATATLDLRIDYMRAAKPGATVTAHAICYHMTRSVAFVRVSATDGSSEVPVAAATGAFTVERGKS